MLYHNRGTHFQRIIENDDAAQRIGINANAGVTDEDGVSGL